MLTVTELANKTGTMPDTVRYYTRIGLLYPQRHPGNGYRLYETPDVTWLHFIHRAKRLGYPLSEIREIMVESRQGRSPCPRVREILLRNIDQNRKHLDELLALQTRMEQALDQWKDLPDGTPDGHTICQLIESFVEK